MPLRPPLHHLLRPASRIARPFIRRHVNPRQFSELTALRPTDAKQTEGVYSGLGIMKVKKPWLTALAESQSTSYAEAESSEMTPQARERKLTPKKMADSFSKLVLPLGTDEWLVDSYVNASGQLRLGSLFQDLDAMAGVIAYKHAGPDLTIVTAAVDRICIINPLTEFCDLQLSGFVSYVGKSSMEISLEARRIARGSSAPVSGPEGVLLECTFTMVARDPATKKAAPVNPLLVETAEEKRVFARGEENKAAKQQLAKADLTRQTPSAEEARIIHDLFLSHSSYEDPDSAAKKPEGVAYMSTTTISSASINQPQYRNRHSFMIFGGFLLKQTMELAFCCASAFAHTRPTFVSLDPSTFLAPVPVGSILYLDATVAYTEPAPSGRGSRIQVRVESKVRDVEHGKTTGTGVFNYTFYVGKSVAVMPVKYEDFMRYLEARRRAVQQKKVGGVDDGTRARVTE